jgi:hypothetical protein
VQYEIESWYYAGVSEDACKKMKLKHFQNNTDDLTKEDFNNKIRRLSDRKSIMLQMLNEYSLGLAVTRNTSLSVFEQAVKKT